MGRRLIVSISLFLGTVPLTAADSPIPFVSALFPSAHSAELLVRETPVSEAPSIFEGRFRGSYVLSRSTSTIWSIQQTVGEAEISRPIQIEQTGVIIPQKLWEIETGGVYQHKTGERKAAGVAFSVGSASDKPFHSIHETVLKLTGIYRVPSKANNSWIFLLSYSNNRHFANNIPLPGAAYVIHSSSSGLDAVIGFPFVAVNVRRGRANQRLWSFGPRNLSVESSYRVAGPIETYAGFDWNERSWFRADREDNKKRLFFEQKRWGFGVRFPVPGKIRLDLGSGYEYNRRFYENKRATEDPIPGADLKSTWFMQIKASRRW